MSEYYLGLVERMIGESTSGYMPIILVGVGLISHLYYLIIKERKAARQLDHDKQVAQKEYDAQRNSEILAVVKENTAAITQNTAVSASLKVLFESMSTDVKSSITRTHSRIDDVLKDTSELKVLLRSKCRGAMNDEGR